MKTLPRLNEFPDVRQSTLNSCVSAALSAVLQYLGHAWSEADVMDALGNKSFKDIDALIAGFPALSSLRSVLETGLTPADVLMRVESRIDVGDPIMLSTAAKVPGRAHIVVALGYDAEKLLLHDPGQGQTTMSRQQLTTGPEYLKDDCLVIRRK